MRDGTGTDRFGHVKTAYTTRHVRPEAFAGVSVSGVPCAGDLVLARVVALGQHARLERTDGRRATLLVDDEVVVAYGDRYAPDQFEAEVPRDLGICHLVAAGGVAGRVTARHANVAQPTVLDPVGFVTGHDGRRINVRDWALPPATPRPDARMWTIVVVGTSMNSGKTTTAGGIVHALRRRGARAGSAKVTGTGAGGDLWFMVDAGANPALDFTHAGLASTYRCAPRVVEAAVSTLHGQLLQSGVEVAVLEVADGIHQQETAALLRSSTLRRLADGFVFAADSAVAAEAGVRHLRELGLPVLAVSGAVTGSPLATREARRRVDVPVLTSVELFGADPSSGRTVGAEPVTATPDLPRYDDAQIGALLAPSPVDRVGRP